MPKVENQTGVFSVVNYENAGGVSLSFTMQVMTESNDEPDDSVLVIISTKDDEDGVSISVPADALVTMLKRLLRED